MKMPQDFVDAINAAVKEINPNAGTMTYGSMTLGSDFDEWLGIDALMKYALGPVPPEVEAAFQKKFEEHREEIKASIVASAVDVEKRRMAGLLSDGPPRTKQSTRNIDDVVVEIGSHRPAD